MFRSCSKNCIFVAVRNRPGGLSPQTVARQLEAEFDVCLDGVLASMVVKPEDFLISRETKYTRDELDCVMAAMTNAKI